MSVLFTAEGISKHYRDVTALHEMSMELHEQRSLGIIGESGSGKTTLARLLLGLSRPDTGRLHYRGLPVMAGVRGPSQLRREVQLVLQDPYASLNPRMRIGQIIGEPLVLLGLRVDRRARVREVLAQVDIDPAWANRYPHELSGGQRQRVAIARALAPRPKVIIADEPVSALDVSVRVKILALLQHLVASQDVTLVVISHDLGIVQRLCVDTMVLAAGQVVERGVTAQILRQPRHPATIELMAAVPRLPV